MSDEYDPLTEVRPDRFRELVAELLPKIRARDPELGREATAMISWRIDKKPARTFEVREERMLPLDRYRRLVRRPPLGMSTDSIASPSARRQRYFRVPSDDCWITSGASRGRGCSRSSASRRTPGSSVAASHRSTGATHSRRTICSSR